MKDKTIERPEIVTDEHLNYLNKLCESGTVNIFSADLYLRDEFDLKETELHQVLWYWMETFIERIRDKMPYYLNPLICQTPDPEDDNNNDNDTDNDQDDDGSGEVEYSDPTHFDGEPLEDLDDDE